MNVDNISNDTLMVIWNDIKDFGSGFWAFFILISFYILKDQIKDFIKMIISKLSLKPSPIKYTKKHQ